MQHTLEFFFDCSSPWTYLAFESIFPLIEQAPVDVELVWKPILVGGVFNSINPSVYQNRENPVPAKARYYQKDLQDWADYVGVSIGMPKVFPVNSVKAMRGALLAMEEGRVVPYARCVFQHYWGALQDISDSSVLCSIAEEAGLDAESFLDRISDQYYKDLLRANTDELVRRGGFGSPTLFLNENDMYFGNDRLPLLKRKLHQA